MSTEIRNDNPSKETIIQTLKTIFDPEFRVDIYNLGLIYEIDVDRDDPLIKMTLTTPTCPAATQIITETKHKIEKLIPDGKQLTLEMTFDPAWKPSMITREGLRMLPSQLVDHLDLDDMDDDGD